MMLLNSSDWYVWQRLYSIRWRVLTIGKDMTVIIVSLCIDSSHSTYSALVKGWQVFARGLRQVTQA